MYKSKKKPKHPRAFFKVAMGTQIIPPKKGKGSKDTSPYSRKSKHKKTTANEKFEASGFFFWQGLIWPL